MIKIIKKFYLEYANFKRNPTGRSVRLARLSIFLCQVFEFYRGDLKFLVETISSLLETYAGQMSFLNREKCLQSLIILSKKGFWKVEEAIKFYTRLLMLQDKNLRELIHKHIIYLIKKHDFQGRNSSIHRTLVEFFQKVIIEGEDDLVKRVIKILITLYNKRIWKDTKTINVIGNACMGTYAGAVKLAGMFFVETTEKVEEELDSSEDEISEDEYETNLYKVSF
jgi:hypothetical protein